MKIYNLKNKTEFLEEVARLEYDEWADSKNYNTEERLKNKINRIKESLSNTYFCKLILIDNKELIGFISIFPSDCDEEPNLTPWYATMYIKKEYRKKGYSKVLNNAILKEANNRGFDKLYLKSDLNNYYEKFGAIYIKTLKTGEKLYYINTKQQIIIQQDVNIIFQNNKYLLGNLPRNWKEMQIVYLVIIEGTNMEETIIDFLKL